MLKLNHGVGPVCETESIVKDVAREFLLHLLTIFEPAFVNSFKRKLAMAESQKTISPLTMKVKIGSLNSL